MSAFNTWIHAQSAHSYLRSGDDQYTNQDFESAEIDYRKALEKEKSTKGSYNLGNTIYNQQRFDEAIRHYESAASAAKDKETRSKAYHNLGNAYFGQQEFDKSVNAFKNALRQNPKDVETKFNLSKAQEQLRLQQQQQQQQRGRSRTTTTTKRFK